MKMRQITNFFTFWIFLMALLLLTCSTPEVGVGPGSGSTTTNGMVGCLVDENGVPAARTKVMLVASNYDPVKDHSVPDSLIDTTDMLGRYSFSKINNGEYAILALHINNRTSAIIRGIQVNDDIDTIPPDTLRQPGSVKVVLPTNTDNTNGYVYIPGTIFFAFLKNSSGFVTLDSVPAGETDIKYSTTKMSSSTVLRYGIRVKSRDTVIVLNPGWSYSRKCRLNTSSSGADISGNVTNFPVLIRLTADNFDFAQAKNNGEDIRFTKTDNTFLPYEIERWDPATKRAEVWVKVDTIYGSDSAQAITMYWGASILQQAQDSASLSNGAAVFDTANGFAGVWHLGQPAGLIVQDATSNGIDGIATETVTVSGAIGAGQSFNGTSSLIRSSGSASDKLNFSDTGTYSVSAWVKASALDSLCQAIVFKSNAQYGMQIIPEKKWEFNTYIDKTRWEGSRSPASADSWHALTGVRNGKKQYLYVDGVCIDSLLSNTIALPPENIGRVYDMPLEIGHCPDGGRNPDRFFNGIIDEVRISRTALNADWIKLCYMNQKEKDVLVNVAGSR